MNAAGIIVEYNPLHMGHVHLLEQTRRHLGEDTALVCCMSGDFVQRGDFALLRRAARARAAVESGADLVLELPLPWAVSSAEGFAQGAVETLLAANVLTHLSFGSECGEAGSLLRVAAALEEAGEPVEYIHCSGDPHSLDGVVFPKLGAAIVDGTAPHGRATKQTF